MRTGSGSYPFAPGFTWVYIIMLSHIGPEEKEKAFYKIEEEGLPIHHDMRGKERQNYMCELENWEAAKVS